MQGIVWILFFYLLGCVVSALTGNFIPGSVVGMLLLFGALSAGWLRPWRMKRAAGFLLDNMMLFFIPVGVGLITSYTLLRRYMLDDPKQANDAQDRTSEAVAIKLL